MQPQSPRFFGRSSYTPSSSSSSASGYGVQKKSLFENKKLIIIIIVAGIFLVSLFAVVGGANKKNNSTSLDEFYSSLSEFKLEYNIFLNEYESYIGFEPTFEISEGDIFPISTLSMDEFVDQKEKVANLSSKIVDYKATSSSGFSDEQKNNLSELKKKINDQISSMSANVELLSQFYDVFYKPIFEQLKSDKKQSNCVVSDEMQSLLDSKNKNISEAASLSKDAYCSFITTVTNKTSENRYEELCFENHQRISLAFDVLKKNMRTLNKSELEINDLMDGINED